MRFKQYLQERLKPKEVPTLDEINSIIQKDCKPYLKLLKGKEPLYRGVNSPDVFGKKNTKKDRIPRGSSNYEFGFINQWLIKNGHNNRKDNIMICTSDYKRAQRFGIVCYVFPIGKISYTWIDAKDFNENNWSTGWYSTFIIDYLENVDFNLNNFEDNPSMKEYEKNYNYKMSKPFADYFHTDENFNTAYEKGYEIWFKCKSYYYIMLDYLDNNSVFWKNGKFEGV